MTIEELSEADILAELRSGFDLDAARALFSQWSARIDREVEQGLTWVEMRRLETRAVIEIAALSARRSRSDEEPTVRPPAYGRQRKAVREVDAETERLDALSRRDWRDRCDDEREEGENDGRDQRQ
jgi:hypothetical protein